MSTKYNPYVDDMTPEQRQARNERLANVIEPLIRDSYQWTAPMAIDYLESIGLTLKGNDFPFIYNLFLPIDPA